MSRDGAGVGVGGYAGVALSARGDGRPEWGRAPFPRGLLSQRGAVYLVTSATAVGVESGCPAFVPVQDSGIFYLCFFFRFGKQAGGRKLFAWLAKLLKLKRERKKKNEIVRITASRSQKRRRLPPFLSPL